MRLVALFLGLLLVASCGTRAPRLPSQSYQAPPETSSARGNAKVVTLPPDAAASQVLSGLENAGLTPDHIDLGRGIVVATYSGNPEGLVECGVVRFGGGRSLPAARQSFVVNDLTPQEISGGRVGRDLQLDTRLVVTAQPFGTSTSVQVDATHVVTKTIAVGDQKVRTETIAFDSEGSGRFDKGTSCRSTGKLEELALAGVPGPLVRLAVPQGQQVAVSQSAPMPLGTIHQTEIPPPGAPVQQAAVPRSDMMPSTGVQAMPGTAIATTTQGAPLSCAELAGVTADQMCEVLMLLAPYRTGALSARLLEGDRPLSVGDDLVLELDLPGEPANLQLSYVDSTGVVTHLPTLPLRGDVRHSIYATGLAVTPPAGQEVFLVMASSNQPIGGVRPPREPLATYAAALRQGLSQRDVRLDAAAVVVETLDR